MPSVRVTVPLVADTTVTTRTRATVGPSRPRDVSPIAADTACAPAHGPTTPAYATLALAAPAAATPC